MLVAIWLPVKTIPAKGSMNAAMPEVTKSRRHAFPAEGAETAIASAMIHVTKKTIAPAPPAALVDAAPAMATTVETRIANISPATNPARIFILNSCLHRAVYMLDSGIAAKRHCCPAKICHTSASRRKALMNEEREPLGPRAQKKALLGKTFFQSRRHVALQPYLTSTISKAQLANSSLTSITCKIPNATRRREPSRSNAKSPIIAFAEARFSLRFASKHSESTLGSIRRMESVLSDVSLLGLGFR